MTAVETSDKELTMQAPNLDAWQDRLAAVVETMREMSLQTDPQEMVRAYGRRMSSLFPAARRMSLSRRDLPQPEYRITRYSGWTTEINPWKQVELLPRLNGGLLAELIYADAPRIIHDLEIAGDDPAFEYLESQRSLLAVPLFDRGEALNMVVLTSESPSAFCEEEIPERVWMANLFGRATQNLVLAEQLDEAYRAVDRELQVVAEIQQSLLPREMPIIPGLSIAAHYQTSRRAGGDYYDFFALPDGSWGMLIADVSGHGTPAAVVMAVTHSIAHTYPGRPTPPGDLLSYLTRHLTARYTQDSGHFVTAFYAVYQPETRTLTYACAGHNPPRLRRCGSKDVLPLDQANTLPLGINCEWTYANVEQTLRSGDRLVLYTDGITEAANRAGEMFGVERLDNLVGSCDLTAQETVDHILKALHVHDEGQPPSDDRTLMIIDVH